MNFDKLSREIFPSHFNISSSKIVGELGVVAAQHKNYPDIIFVILFCV